jgi:hypothetical protein
VTSPIPAPSCPRPNPPFADSFVRLRPLSPTKCARSTGTDCGTRRVQVATRIIMTTWLCRAPPSEDG